MKRTLRTQQTTLPDQSESLPVEAPLVVKRKFSFRDILSLIKKHFVYIILILAGAGIALYSQFPELFQGYDASAAENTAQINLQPSQVSASPATTLQLWATTSAPTGFVAVEIDYTPAVIRLTGDITLTNSKLTKVIKQTSYSEANSTGKLFLTLGLDPAYKANAPQNSMQLGTLNFAAVTPAVISTTDVSVSGTYSSVVGMDATFMNISASGAVVTLPVIGPTTTVTPTPITTIVPTRTPTITPTRTPTITPTRTPTSTLRPNQTATPTPLTTTAPFVISNVQATNISQTTATITWLLSDYGTGQVEYGKTISYGLFSTPETSFDWNHHAQSLSGLTSGALYHYRVKSTDRTGQTAVSGDYTFTTLGTGGTSTPTPTSAPTPTPPEAKTVLTGTVYTAVKQPIVNATVVISQAIGKKYIEVARLKTDTAGQYSITLDYGTYRIQYSASGYRTQTQTVSLQTATTEIAVYLKEGRKSFRYTLSRFMTRQWERFHFNRRK
jgi:hypothetical protein